MYLSEQGCFTAPSDNINTFFVAVFFAKQSNLASEGKVNLHRLSYFQTKSLRESCRSASACCCCLAKIGKQGFLHQQRLVCDYQPVADCFIFTANAPHNKLMRQTLFFRTDLRFSLQTLPGSKRRRKEFDRLPSSKAGNGDNDPYSRRATLTKMLFLGNAKARPRKLLGWHSTELVIEVILIIQQLSCCR